MVGGTFDRCKTMFTREIYILNDDQQQLKGCALLHGLRENNNPADLADLHGNATKK